MKVALQKDVVSTKKYMKDIQICTAEVQEYVSKKGEECIYQGNHFLSDSEYWGNVLFFFYV